MPETPPLFATQAQAHQALRLRAHAARAWLMEHALPIWWARGFDHEARCFHEQLDLSGDPAPASRRVRVQARQTAVYAMAGRLGWQGPWRDATEAGAAVLLGRAKHPSGGVVHVLGADGAPLDSRRDLYDLAFVVFALAHAGRALEQSALIEAAEAHIAWIEAHWSHAAGGFLEGEVAPCPPRRQNPHMHLFEALIALCEITAKPEHFARAERLYTLFATRFYDSTRGALPEFFTDDWRPASGELGLHAEPGHHFEWSWLLQRYSKLTATSPHPAADRLCAYGEAYGIDRARGVARDEIWIDGAIKSESARLWPQTERLKANAGLYALSGELRAAEAAAQAFDTLTAYFDTPTRGLWRDRMQPDGRFTEQPAPASSFYHIMVALDDFIRLFSA